MQKNRQQIIEDFFLSFRSTGQLLLKCLQCSLEDEDQVHLGGLMLLKILKRNGAQSQNQIAQHLCHSEAAISRQVAIAQEKGLVAVSIDPGNRRSSIISLTQEGEKVFHAVNQKTLKELSQIISDISVAELENVIMINKKIQEALLMSTKQEVNVKI